MNEDSDGEEDQEQDNPSKGHIRDMYPGTQLQICDPTKYDAIVQLLARGIPKRNIAKDMHCNYYVVSNIEARCFPEIVAAKQMLSAKLLSAATASIDSAEQRAIQGKAGALDAKLLIEAYLNINGEASSIVDINVSWPQLQEFSAIPLAEGRIVDVQAA